MRTRRPLLLPQTSVFAQFLPGNRCIGADAPMPKTISSGPGHSRARHSIAGQTLGSPKASRRPDWGRVAQRLFQFPRPCPSDASMTPILTGISRRRVQFSALARLSVRFCSLNSSSGSVKAIRDATFGRPEFVPSWIHSRSYNCFQLLSHGLSFPIGGPVVPNNIMVRDNSININAGLCRGGIDDPDRW
jgi:hypothetical protein